MEKIISAAIQDERGLIYSVPRPKRHHEIIYMMAKSGMKRPLKTDLGFLTSEGRFVDRVEGLKIAEEARQVAGSHAGMTKLYTESMW